MGGGVELNKNITVVKSIKMSGKGEGKVEGGGKC